MKWLFSKPKWSRTKQDMAVDYLVDNVDEFEFYFDRQLPFDHSWIKLVGQRAFDVDSLEQVKAKFFSIYLK